MPSTWAIRRYQPGDETQICDLFEKVFEKTMGQSESLNFWRWAYLNNPCSRIEILVAVDAERIVGQYAVLPVRMCINGRKVTGSLALDIMTHPDYRGQGMFPKLAGTLFEELGKTNIPITFGFPNENIIDGYIKKLNWEEIAPVPILAKPISYLSIVKAILKIGKKESLKQNWISNSFGDILDKNPCLMEIDAFNEEFDELYEDGRKSYLKGVVRDSKYLNWRYLKRPESNYSVIALKDKTKLKGYIVLKIDDLQNLRCGIIMDILTKKSCIDEGDVLLKAAIDIFKREKVSLITMLCLPGSPYYTSVRKRGFMKVPKWVLDGEVYFGAHLNNDEQEMETIFDPKNWHLSWGDSDVF